jgi:HSP20 family protein
MTALMPRLFGDVVDWFETDFPLRPGTMIRVEDELGEQDYTIRAEVPGVDPERDVEVSVGDGVMTIQAERREEEKAPDRSEFRYGMMRRSVRLPANADTEHITANYDKGILLVKVPLTQPEREGRKIPITAGE